MPNKKLIDTLSWQEICDKIQRETENDSSKFRKWLESKDDLKGSFFSSKLWLRLYNIQKNVVNNDADHFIVVAGTEGTGKSTLAVQMAGVLSPEFKTKNICYNPKDFISGLRTAQKGDVFVLDEGNLFLFSRESQSGDNRNMVKLFALMRQKNIVVIICVPNFFTIDTYVRNHRVDSLIYIKRKSVFTCYVGKAIKLISEIGHKTKQIKGVITPAGTFFNGSFNSQFPLLNDISAETYKQFKGEHFDNFLEQLENSYDKIEAHPDMMSTTAASKLVSLSSRYIVRLIEAGKVAGKLHGNKYLVDRKALLRYAGAEKNQEAGSGEASHLLDGMEEGSSDA